MNVLVIDVGGTHVKMRRNASGETRRFASGPQFTPGQLVDSIRVTTEGWEYDVISLGVPAAVDGYGVRAEPGNLGEGWVDFDFGVAFGKPVRIVNDAVLQALGAYDSGRMLFLGLGTGLGSALITEHVVVPLELGVLPFGPGETIADRLGKDGLAVRGRYQWLQDLAIVTHTLQTAFAADYIVIGGGNAELVDHPPDRVRCGGNQDAFTGGVRLWEELVEPHDREPARVWRVVR